MVIHMIVSICDKNMFSNTYAYYLYLSVFVTNRVNL